MNSEIACTQTDIAIYSAGCLNRNVENIRAWTCDGTCFMTFIGSERDLLHDVHRFWTGLAS